MPGFIHHVTGDLVTGMRYERKIGKIPEESGTFHSKELLGKIQATDYPARVDQSLHHSTSSASSKEI